ncbi:MAG: methyltransferase domain-containing protein [Nitrospinae bacterium]|nr:methyltransferase domain-containing protein [Nitrospinota bacterium]
MENKKKISASFSKAAKTYDTVSDIQKKAAKDLIEKVKRDIKNDKVVTILDIGCGTGALFQELADFIPSCLYFGLDISPDMLKVASTQHGKNLNVVCADMDNLPFSSFQFDFIISSSTLQWGGKNLFPWLHECNRLLKPSGRFIFNLMIKGSLENFYNAYNTVMGVNSQLHIYPDTKKLLTELRDNFNLLECKEKKYQKSYTHILDFLRDIQKTGAKSVLIEKNNNRLTKEKLYAIEKTMKGNRDEINLLYNYLFVTCKQP